MATHSSILAWRIPWTEEPGSPQGYTELDKTEVALHLEKGLLLFTGPHKNGGKGQSQGQELRP